MYAMNFWKIRDGRLWIGTNNGIYIYDKQKQTLQHIGKKEECLLLRFQLRIHYQR